ncbi:hypothetical protein CYMTET_38161 [Cymbomonas tetramitiformis]|uniref:Uncharacterized protein n=1 Tax=Cymbomonas tetramitiformis TaxID=36881 RepID=A0AAE0F5H5_9CHLO|nr:hypothetical protein CYMTET_38161 [Cymbomonas tetramitiformis]
MAGSSKGKGSGDFLPIKEVTLQSLNQTLPALPGKDGHPPSPSPTPAVQPTQESLLQQILKIQKQQAEDHRVLREQLHRQVEINAALEAKIASKTGSSDSEAVAKTAEQLLEKRKRLDYVPEAPVNPFPARPATLTTRMPQLYDLHGNKTYDALSKKSNSSMRYECLVLGPALSYLHDVVTECNETLDEAEEDNVPYDTLYKRFHAVTNSVHGVYAMLCNRWTMLELRAQLEQAPGSSQRGGNDALRAKLQFVENKVYQAADGVVADEVLQQWLNDFDKSRGKALLNSAAKNAANAEARLGRDQREHRWWDKKRNDEEKDRKPSGKGGKGRGAKPSSLMIFHPSSQSCIMIATLIHDPGDSHTSSSYANFGQHKGGNVRWH